MGLLRLRGTNTSPLSCGTRSFRDDDLIVRFWLQQRVFPHAHLVVLHEAYALPVFVLEVLVAVKAGETRLLSLVPVDVAVVEQRSCVTLIWWYCSP